MVFKKKDVFLETLYEIAQNVNEAAKYFNEFKIDSEASVATFTQKMKEYEHKGDSYVHDLIHALNKAFITTIEREDILNLAVVLDDVLDGMEACASRFYMYDVYQSDDFMRQLGANIAESTSEILKAMDLLRNRNLLKIREYTVKINKLETDADTILRTSVRNLFQNSKDPIHIMKYKEMYEILERVSDSCEDVADQLETIIMRNS